MSASGSRGITVNDVESGRAAAVAGDVFPPLVITPFAAWHVVSGRRL